MMRAYSGRPEKVCAKIIHPPPDWSTFVAPPPINTPPLPASIRRRGQRGDPRQPRPCASTLAHPRRCPPIGRHMRAALPLARGACPRARPETLLTSSRRVVVFLARLIRRLSLRPTAASITPHRSYSYPPIGCPHLRFLSAHLNVSTHWPISSPSALCNSNTIQL